MRELIKMRKKSKEATFYMEAEDESAMNAALEEAEAELEQKNIQDRARFFDIREPIGEDRSLLQAPSLP